MNGMITLSINKKTIKYDYNDTFYSLTRYLANSTNFQFDDKDLMFYG
ncbi:MAG: hypothetical protein LBV22_01755 [Mycoplasmataceae bacterium]|nr:hypothetical protein [Mycoplasmataceae bacterium]